MGEYFATAEELETVVVVSGAVERVVLTGNEMVATAVPLVAVVAPPGRTGDRGVAPPVAEEVSSRVADFRVAPSEGMEHNYNLVSQKIKAVPSGTEEVSLTRPPGTGAGTVVDTVSLITKVPPAERGDITVLTHSCFTFLMSK